MKKSFVEEKRTDVKFTAEEIKGTPFVKWFADIVVNFKVNGWFTPITCKQSKKCGICLKEEFDKLDSINMPVETVYVEEMYKNCAYVVAIKKSAMQDVMSCNKHITEVIEKITFENINSSEYDFYLFNSGAYQLMDLGFVFVTLPIFMDYIDTRLTNENYDLKESLKKIKNSPYVVNREKVDIEDIPYYNATEVETEKIDFNIILPLEFYKKYQSFEYTSDGRRFILNEVLGIKEK